MTRCATPHQELRITVDCYAGHRGEQTPRAFALGERRITATSR